MAAIITAHVSGLPEMWKIRIHILMRFSEDGIETLFGRHLVASTILRHKQALATGNPAYSTS